MNRFRLALISIAFSLAVPAYAIEFWHSNTVWAGQGQCAAEFTFDSGLEEVEDLRMTFSAINKSGKKVMSGEIEVDEPFGQSSATRFASALAEGEELCDDGHTIVINKASAKIDGKRVDLLKSGALSARDFKPFKIRLGK